MKVAKEILSHGVTSFCPTLVTSPTETYHQVLPQIKKKEGGVHGASILGVHVEGPFISIDKKGAHPAHCIRDFDEGFKTVEEVYGDISDICIITLAPEKQRAPETISELVKRGITVSVGHSMADLKHGETAVKPHNKLTQELLHHRTHWISILTTETPFPKLYTQIKHIKYESGLHCIRFIQLCLKAGHADEGEAAIQYYKLNFKTSASAGLKI